MALALAIFALLVAWRAFCLAERSWAQACDAYNEARMARLEMQAALEREETPR